LAEAVDCHASDIHLEPSYDRLRVRYRIDGILYDKEAISTDYAAQIASRIKILSHVDVSEKRLPQDGKFSIMHHTRPIDMRVSTSPGIDGEKIVIRILDRSGLLRPLEQLGMQTHHLHQAQDLLQKPNGFILVTGPTGSGKTTTLYAALSMLSSAEKNVV